MTSINETHYEVLGIAREASTEAIRAAYLLLVAQYHPDRHQGNPLEDLAREKLVRINQAYETLVDPKRRALYDAQLNAARSQQPRGSSDPHRPFMPRQTQQMIVALLLILSIPLLWKLVVLLLRAVWRVITIL